jgi:hypothetical protein
MVRLISSRVISKVVCRILYRHVLCRGADLGDSGWDRHPIGCSFRSRARCVTHAWETFARVAQRRWLACERTMKPTHVELSDSALSTRQSCSLARCKIRPPQLVKK